MPTDLLGQIHSSTAVTPSPDWVNFRSEVTGMYLLSGQGGEWDSQHLIREYNRNINSLYKSWTPTEPNATGLFIEPYNAGFSYQGTGDFRDYKWDAYSVDFDGVDEYVDCGVGLGDFLGDNYAGSLTVSLWFKADVTDHQDGIFALREDGNHGKFQFSMWEDEIQFQLNGTSWKREVAFTDTASWHHLVCIYAAGSAVNSKMYLDGVAVGSFDPARTFPSASDMDFAGLNTIIGGFVNTSYLFNGKIDEVAVWNSALSAAQITAIYNGGTPQSLAQYSPTAWWRMGDSVGGVGGLVTDLVATDTNALFLPGVSYNFASIPDPFTAALGNFTVQVDGLTPEVVRPSAQVTLIAQDWDSLNKSFTLNVNAAGAIYIWWFKADLVLNILAVPWVPTDTVGIRFSRDGTDWTVLVDTGSGYGAHATGSMDSDALFDSTAAVNIGAYQTAGGGQPMKGGMSRARWWITATPDTSTPVLDINFALADKGATSFEATIGGTVTIHTTDIDDPAVIRGATDGVLVNEATFTTDTP